MVNRPLGQLPRGQSPERTGPAARRAQNRRPQAQADPQMFANLALHNPQSMANAPSPRRRKERTPFIAQRKTTFAVMGAAAFGLCYVGMPKLINWFETREGGTITVAPPTGRVERYSALVTGTAEADFSIQGRTGCGGWAGGNVIAESNWHAAATVANKIGSFTVAVTPDRTQVTINYEQYPDIQGGIQLDKSELSVGEDSFWSTCDGDEVEKIAEPTMEMAQAAAQTIDDCIVRHPDFLQGLKDQSVAFGQAAYPGATVNVVLPQVPATSESASALSALSAQWANEGIGIEADAIQNCEFASFEMVPIVFTPGDTNG